MIEIKLVLGMAVVPLIFDCSFAGPTALVSTFPHQSDTPVMGNSGQSDNDAEFHTEGYTLGTEDEQTYVQTHLPKNTETNVSLSMRALASQTLRVQVGKVITLYGTPAIIIVGLAGNTLSLLVMLQAHNQRISCSTYMVALACTDNLVLAVSGYYWGVTQLRQTGFHRAECKVLDFLLVASSFAGILYIISMTTDRVVAVRFPLHSRAWCTPRRARTCAVTLSGLSLIYSAPYILITTEDSSGFCNTESYRNAYVTFYAWLNVCLNSVVPFLSLAVLNGVIIKTIHNRKKFFLKDRKSQEQGQGHDQGQRPRTDDDTKTRERQLTLMLVLVSVTVLMLTLPRYVRYAVFSFVRAGATPDRLADYILATHVTSRLYTINNAINFFLYCVGGSKFREDLGRICCRCARVVTEDGNSSDSMTETSHVNTQI